MSWPLFCNSFQIILVSIICQSYGHIKRHCKNAIYIISGQYKDLKIKKFWERPLINMKESLDINSPNLTIPTFYHNIDYIPFGFFFHVANESWKIIEATKTVEN